MTFKPQHRRAKAEKYDFLTVRCSPEQKKAIDLMCAELNVAKSIFLMECVEYAMKHLSKDLRA